MRNLKFGFAALLVATLLTGCAKGRNADDKRRQDIAEELARLQSISGFYRGRLVSVKDGATLGSLTIQLQADVRGSMNPTGTRTEEKPRLRTRITVETVRPLDVVFDDSSYDDTNGSVRAQTAVKKADDRTYELNFKGVVKGASLEGSLEAFGFPEDGATFVVERDAEAPKFAPNEIAPGSRSYFAIGAQDNFHGARPSEVALSLVPNPLTREEELLELFLPLKNYRVTVALSASTEIVFSRARWDRKTGQLVAEADAGAGAQTAHFLLTCREGAQPNPELGPAWSCDFSSSLIERIQRLELGAVTAAQFHLPRTPPARSFYFRGSTDLPLIGKKALRMGISYRTPSEAEEFAEYFQNLKVVRATLDFSPDVQVLFENALWNIESGRLTGRASFGQDDLRVDFVLECQGEGGASAPEKGWTCQYTTNLKPNAQFVKFDPLPAGQPPPSLEDRPLNLNASGNVVIPNSGSRRLSLNLSSRSPTKAEQVLEYFYGIRSVRATLTFSRNVQLVFERTQWNLDTGTLRGSAMNTVGGQNAEFTLECAGLTPGAVARAWNCKYSSSFKAGSVAMTLSPSGAAPVPPPPPATREWFYAGSGDFPFWGKRGVNLSLMTRALTRDQEMMEYFRGVLAARATFVFSANAQVVIDNVEWNMDQGTLQGAAAYTIDGTTTVNIVIDCSNADPQAATPNWTCLYTTGLRDQPVPLRMTAKSSRTAPPPPPLPAVSFKYRARTSGANVQPATLPVRMVSRAPEKGFDYIEFFNFMRFLRVSIVFGPDVTIVFDKAQWYRDTHSLVANTHSVFAGQPADLLLECSETSQGAVPGWHCVYSSSLTGLVQNMELTPSP